MLTIRPNRRFDHLIFNGPSYDVEPGQVHIDRAFPMVEGRRFGRDVLEDSGIIHEHVDRPKLVVHLGDHRLDGFLIGDIGLNDHPAGARGFDQLGGFQGVLFARAEIDRDLCSGSCQPFATGTPDATRSAGHQNRPILKVWFAHHILAKGTVDRRRLAILSALFRRF